MSECEQPGIWTSALFLENPPQSPRKIMHFYGMKNGKSLGGEKWNFSALNSDRLHSLLNAACNVPKLPLNLVNLNLDTKEESTC